MNIANLLTLSRMVLAPVYLVLLFVGDAGSLLGALAVFVVAALTDLWDGRIARARGEVTPFGKFMDPLADKVLVVSGLLGLSVLGVVAYWVVAIIVLRELFVTGLRSYVAGRGEFVKPGWLSRVKTGLQMGAVALGTAGLCVADWAPRLGMEWTLGQQLWLGTVLAWVMYLTAAVTVWTGVSYLWKSRELLGEEIRGKD
jgi:CDP-diacylglycerol--glycerol-3-phosphate 3-phosphatidyltransferase